MTCETPNLDWRQLAYIRTSKDRVAWLIWTSLANKVGVVDIDVLPYSSSRFEDGFIPMLGGMDKMDG